MINNPKQQWMIQSLYDWKDYCVFMSNVKNRYKHIKRTKTWEEQGLPFPSIEECFYKPNRK